MPLNFLRETNESILSKLKSDLSFIDSSIDFDELSGLTTRGLERKLAVVTENISKLKTGRYGSWLSNEEYVRDTLLEEAIKCIIEGKNEEMDAERLIIGSVYFTDVKRFGNLIEGKRSVFMGPKYTGWMNFTESTAIAKAKQVLRFGNEDDFREIYIGLADGQPDALNSIKLSHITESSESALAEIEAYCDTRWEGPWPWEIEAPEKLKYMIESREESKMNRIEEMQRTMAKMLREAEEGTMDQFEMVAASKEMMKRVDGMISDLGKLSSNGIETMAQAKSMGDDHIVQPMQAALGEPLNAAVSALTDLKASLSAATSEITGGGSSSSMLDLDDGMGDDMGSPMDAMGDDPIDDVAIGGDEEERPMKGL